jgi:hypothetical protein
VCAGSTPGTGRLSSTCRHPQRYRDYSLDQLEEEWARQQKRALLLCYEEVLEVQVRIPA